MTSHVEAVQNAKEIAEKKNANRVKRALAIVEAGDYQVAMFGRLPAT